MLLMSKSQFARHIGRSPGRITQMIREGVIGGDAIEGVGRAARINVDRAMRQISIRIGAGRSAGPLDLNSGGDEASDKLNQQMKIERLEEIQRRNRLAAIEEQRQQGKLVSAEDMRREIARVTQDVMSVFVGMTPSLADALASKFGVPQRDVLFELQRVTAEKRAEASAARRQAAEQMPATVAVEIELSGNPAG